MLKTDRKTSSSISVFTLAETSLPLSCSTEKPGGSSEVTASSISVHEEKCCLLFSGDLTNPQVWRAGRSKSDAGSLEVSGRIAADWWVDVSKEE
ncbi:hypothetical protein KM043_015444 [Ampulex compressa]|nr:hypothetical protein KM043_015444 [Ampulex compressa]